MKDDTETAIYARKLEVSLKNRAKTLLASKSSFTFKHFFAII